MNAVANVSSLMPKYKSKTEAAWANICQLYLVSEFNQNPVWTRHEALRFYLEGGSYLPDFVHLLEDGRVVVVEVKGSTKQRGYKASRQKLRAAADRFPFFTWMMVVGSHRDGFEVEVLNANA